MKRYVIWISMAAIIGLATACGSGDPSAADGSAGQGRHNDQDIAFAQAMVPHHQQAVDMATMAAGKAADPKVRDLAGRIESAQGPEIQQLRDMLGRWGATTESDMPGMGHGEGMMTDDQMHQLEQATGADFDRMWLQMMIAHHQGAVTMATTEVEQGGDADAKALAQRIVDAQKAEITEMQGMLA